MSRKPSFANLRGTPVPVPIVRPLPSPEPRQDGAAATEIVDRPVSQEDREQIANLSIRDMSFAMHWLARRQGRSLRALMSEAFNDVLRKTRREPDRQMSDHGMLEIDGSVRARYCLSRKGPAAWMPRIALRTAQAMRRAWWFVRRPETVGAAHCV